MRLFTLSVLLVVALVFTSWGKSSAWQGFDPQTVQALKEYAAEQAPASVNIPAIAQVPAIIPPVVSEPVVNYILKTTPPDELIRYFFRDQSPETIERALFIACRESGMGKDRTRNLPWPQVCWPQNRVPAVPYDGSCGADNPHSSASGLFQFIKSWKGWGGYDWDLIVNHDCLEDVEMMRAVWDANGWDPWN